MLQRLGDARVDFLDQMRALAIVPVVLVHYHSDWIPAGAVGVGIFFSLSGFLIATILLEEKEFGPATAFKFIVRRFMRIYPAYLTAVLAKLVLTYFYAPDHWDAILSVVPGVLTFTKVSDSNGYAFLALWTLQIEMAFYVIMPVALLLLGRRRGLLIAVSAMILLTVAVLLGSPQLSPVQIYCGHLAAGALVSAAWKFGLLRRLKISGRILAAASLAGVVLLLMMPGKQGIPFISQLLAASLCGCGMITAFVLDPTLPVLPGSWWIGRISYSIYLIHGIVLDFRVQPNFIWRGFYWLAPVWEFASAGTFLTVTICLSAISYYWIEKPGIRAGKYFTSPKIMSGSIAVGKN